ncbi:hypothetical protein ACFL6G_05345 [candidate division KSB1 bacterium]
MKFLFSIVLLTCQVLQFSCSSPLIDEGHVIDEPLNIPLKDMIAFSAVYSPRPKSYDYKIILADFNDITKHQIIDDKGMSLAYPRFNKNKNMILLNNYSDYVFDGGPGFAIYDVVYNFLYRLNPENTLNTVCGIEPVWFPDGTGFYFRGIQFTTTETFNINDRVLDNFLINGRFGASVEAVIGQDTLLVYACGTPVEPEERCFCLSDFSGNYISKVDNPNLIRYTSDQTIKKYVDGIDFNSKYGLLTYREFNRDSGYIGRIAVTDLKGDYYINYTDGPQDYNPVWGPGGRYILFQRGLRESHYDYFKIMLIDTETGVVRDFILPEDFGAVSVKYPDF